MISVNNYPKHIFLNICAYCVNKGKLHLHISLTLNEGLKAPRKDLTVCFSSYNILKFKQTNWDQSNTTLYYTDLSLERLLDLQDFKTPSA